MTMALESAAQVMRQAMRETVKRHSLWYLVQSALMIFAGTLALAYPAMSSVAVVFFLGWLLIIGGVLQGVSAVSARHVPHFWLQLVSVVLFVIVGVLFLRNPGESLLTLTLLLIVFSWPSAAQVFRGRRRASGREIWRSSRHAGYSHAWSSHRTGGRLCPRT
jgi:uncharacterized membrane protein HdeD (DUF308 family)